MKVVSSKLIQTKNVNNCIAVNGKVIGWHPYSLRIPTPTEEDLK